MKTIWWLLAVALVAGCGKQSRQNGGDLSGTILIDGSSTVAPISAAVAEEFGKMHLNLRIPVGTSGTGGGFKKFLNREIDICDASRPIKSSEADTAQKKGIEYIELPVAFDGLSVVAHPSNTWVDYLTVAELKRIWEPGSSVRNWSDVRPSWPDKKINLYGPGQDSGTFDYFTEVIVGKEDASRADYSPSEDDNALVTGVAGDPNSLGYFGYSYYAENREKLKLVPIKAGGDPVSPSAETIRDGTYAPLSRPLLIYVRRDAADRPEVQAFIHYYLSAEGAQLVEDVKYVPLTTALYDLALKRFEARKAGSVFAGTSGGQGMKLEELFK